MQQIKRVSVLAVLFIATFAAVAQPVINIQPVDTSACVGSSAGFTVSATGTDPLTYQWYFNDTTVIPAGINASYNIGAVSTDNAGTYTVVVTDVNGSVTSAPPAVLTV